MKPSGILFYTTANITDKDELKALGIQSYQQFSEILEPSQWEIMNGYLHDDKKMEELLLTSRCFVCKDGAKIVGMAFIIPSGNPTLLFEASWSYIRMVGVDPEYRGHGIAKALTAQCIEYARTSGEQVIALHTSEFMDAARHIYEQLGFIKHKDIGVKFGKQYWIYLLNLEHASHPN